MDIVEDLKEINENNDIFGTYFKAKAIQEFIESDENKELLKKNNLIAIYGRWGTGKSCVMKTIYNNLDNEKFEKKWFNTWKYEKDDNLAYSLFKFIGKDNFWDDIKDKGENFLENINGIFKSFSKGIELNLGVVNIKPGEALEHAEIEDKKIKQRINDEKCLWEKVDEFEEEFKNITIKGNKRLVIFLDDLDRCESENIVNLISAIKLLLSINENIIFIIGIDKKAVSLALQNKYNNDVNKADEYLEKIFPINFRVLNNLNNDNFINFIHSITLLNNEECLKIERLFMVMNFNNPRHIKKILRKYRIIENYLLEKKIDLDNVQNVIFILFLMILNFKYVDEYNYIIQKDKDKIFKNIKIYKIDANRNKIYINNREYKTSSLKKYPVSSSIDIYKLLTRFSSYNFKKDDIKCIDFKNKKLFIDIEDWLNLFDNDNVLSNFIRYILQDLEYFDSFVTDNQFDDEKMFELIKIIDNII